MRRVAITGILVLLVASFAAISPAKEARTKSQEAHQAATKPAAHTKSQPTHPASQAARTKSEEAHHAVAKGTVWPSGDLKWEPMRGVEGVKVAKLWGDMEKGPYGALVKLPANSKHPLHTHSNAIKAVVVFGEFVYRPEGGTETILGPGSYLVVPGGLRHTSGTRSAGCELFQEQAGKWDMVPVNPPTLAAVRK